MTSAARPFVKWAGGKTQALSELLARRPARIDVYFEPLAGGAALFFALLGDPERAPRRAVLNDLNRELMMAFEVVRDRIDDLAASLRPLEVRYLAADEENRKALYYGAREQAPEDPVEVAARLIFLNKTCYNGLYRVNRKGRFNVPHGRYRRPKILDCDTLRAASRALADTELLCVDFEQACAEAGPGDFVYFDPPFQPLSATSSFTAYTGSDFGRQDQMRLKWCMDDLTQRGVPVMLSNSPHDFVLGMYEGGHYGVERLSARRMINSRGDRRSGATELLVTNYELLKSSTK